MRRLPHLWLVLGHVHGKLDELPVRSSRHGSARKRHHPRRILATPCSCKRNGRSGDETARKGRAPLRYYDCGGVQKRRNGRHGYRRLHQLRAAPSCDSKRGGAQGQSFYRHYERNIGKNAKSMPPCPRGRALHRGTQRGGRNFRRNEGASRLRAFRRLG